MTRAEDTNQGHDRIIDVIASVPAKRLMLLDIVRDVWGGDGPDWSKVQERQPDLNLAMAEVESFTKSTQRAIKALRELPAR